MIFCQSSPNPRENWDSCKYASERLRVGALAGIQRSSALVCKRSQVLCCSFRSLFIATKLQKEFDNESVFPVFIEKPYKNESDLEKTLASFLHLSEIMPIYQRWHQLIMADRETSTRGRENFMRGCENFELLRLNRLWPQRGRRSIAVWCEAPSDEG